MTYSQDSHNFNVSSVLDTELKFFRSMDGEAALKVMKQAHL
jgi:hypothetical protein